MTITGAVEEEASFPGTVEPRYKEIRAKGLITCVRYARFRYIKVLFHTFYYYEGKENRLLYRGLRYIEVSFFEVPLYHLETFLWSSFKR